MDFNTILSELFRSPVSHSWRAFQRILWYYHQGSSQKSMEKHW